MSSRQDAPTRLAKSLSEYTATISAAYSKVDDIMKDYTKDASETPIDACRRMLRELVDHAKQYQLYHGPALDDFNAAMGEMITLHEHDQVAIDLANEGSKSLVKYREVKTEVHWAGTAAEMQTNEATDRMGRIAAFLKGMTNDSCFDRVKPSLQKVYMQQISNEVNSYVTESIAALNDSARFIVPAKKKLQLLDPLKRPDVDLHYFQQRGERETFGAHMPKHHTKDPKALRYISYPSWSLSEKDPIEDLLSFMKEHCVRTTGRFSIAPPSNLTMRLIRHCFLEIIDRLAVLLEEPNLHISASKLPLTIWQPYVLMNQYDWTILSVVASVNLYTEKRDIGLALKDQSLKEETENMLSLCGGDQDAFLHLVAQDMLKSKVAGTPSANEGISYSKDEGRIPPQRDPAGLPRADYDRIFNCLWLIISADQTLELEERYKIMALVPSIMYRNRSWQDYNSTYFDVKQIWVYEQAYRLAHNKYPSIAFIDSWKDAIAPVADITIDEMQSRMGLSNSDQR